MSSVSRISHLSFLLVIGREILPPRLPPKMETQEWEAGRRPTSSGVRKGGGKSSLLKLEVRSVQALSLISTPHDAHAPARNTRTRRHHHHSITLTMLLLSLQCHHNITLPVAAERPHRPRMLKVLKQRLPEARAKKGSIVSYVIEFGGQQVRLQVRRLRLLAHVTLNMMMATVPRHNLCRQPNLGKQEPNPHQAPYRRCRLSLRCRQKSEVRCCCDTRGRNRASGRVVSACDSRRNNVLKEAVASRAQ